MQKNRRVYAGEGRTVNDPSTSAFTRPIFTFSRFCMKWLGLGPKNEMKLSRDFYAAITSDRNYVILGEQRYGMSQRIASIKKPKPTPPKPKLK